MQKPLCFILMPFGQKPGVGGAVIDFDAVYRDLIKPAIDAAGLWLRGLVAPGASLGVGGTVALSGILVRVAKCGGYLRGGVR